MVAITFVEHDGTSHRVDVASDQSLMEAARRNGVPGILATCGGRGGCATCHVYVDPRWKAMMGGCSANERRTLYFAVKPGDESRLACFIKVSDAMDGLIVRLPERQF